MQLWHSYYLQCPDFAVSHSCLVSLDVKTDLILGFTGPYTKVDLQTLYMSLCFVLVYNLLLYDFYPPIKLIPSFICNNKWLSSKELREKIRGQNIIEGRGRKCRLEGN